MVLLHLVKLRELIYKIASDKSVRNQDRDAGRSRCILTTLIILSIDMISFVPTRTPEVLPKFSICLGLLTQFFPTRMTAKFFSSFIGAFFPTRALKAFISYIFSYKCGRRACRNFK